MNILALLILAHLLADYALQGDFMAKAKNHYSPIPGVPALTVLVSHAAIHGIAVGAITGVWWLGAFELIAHALIDDQKCRRRFGFNVDQALHIACKVAYVAVLGAMK